MGYGGNVSMPKASPNHTIATVGSPEYTYFIQNLTSIQTPNEKSRNI